MQIFLFIAPLFTCIKNNLEFVNVKIFTILAILTWVELLSYREIRCRVIVLTEMCVCEGV